MNYCKKHNQHYLVKRCPICLGEKMVDYTHKDAENIFEKAIDEYDRKKKSN